MRAGGRITGGKTNDVGLRGLKRAVSEVKKGEYSMDVVSCSGGRRDRGGGDRDGESEGRERQGSSGRGI